MITDIVFNDKVILKKLTESDADFLYNLYSKPELLINFDSSPFLPNETPQQFTNRIITACKYIWTIREVRNPEFVIGDCALHDWDKIKAEILIGGSLSPEYWGQGIMQSSFELLIKLSKEHLGVKILLGQTKTRNLKAIRLMERMWFEKITVDEQDTFMRKVISK